MVLPLKESPPSVDATSRVEVASSGYWYSVLSPDHRRVFAYFTDSDLLATGEIRDPGFFFRELEQTSEVGSLLDECRIEARPAETGGCAKGQWARPRVRPASSSRRRRMVGDGWYALGDAAMTFDPICSQGIYTAMRLGLEAARTIEKGSRQAVDRFQAYADQTWNRYLFSLGECYFTAEPRCTSKSEAEFWHRRRLENINRWVTA